MYRFCFVSDEEVFVGEEKVELVGRIARFSGGENYNGQAKTHQNTASFHYAIMYEVSTNYYNVSCVSHILSSE